MIVEQLAIKWWAFNCLGLGGNKDLFGTQISGNFPILRDKSQYLSSTVTCILSLFMPKPKRIERYTHRKCVYLHCQAHRAAPGVTELQPQQGVHLRLPPFPPLAHSGCRASSKAAALPWHPAIVCSPKKSQWGCIKFLYLAFQRNFVFWSVKFCFYPFFFVTVYLNLTKVKTSQDRLQAEKRTKCGFKFGNFLIHHLLKIINNYYIGKCGFVFSESLFKYGNKYHKWEKRNSCYSPSCQHSNGDNWSKTQCSASSRARQFLLFNQP